jgi:transposase InsO family protein
MTTIARSLDVSRSNLIERSKKEPEGLKRTRQRVSRKDDAWLLPLIRRFTDERPTYGYRRITRLVARELRICGKSAVNHKRVYRIMRENCLCLQRYATRPTRTHDGKIITLKSNLRWCSDGFEIQCWNGEKLQVAFSLDCHDREAIRWVTSSRGLDGALVRDLMTETLEARFGAVTKLPHTVQWLTDNGPGYVAHDTVEFGRILGFEVCTTAPYSPESNGMAEAFVETFKRDYVYLGDLSNAEIVRTQLPKWFDDYNEQAPHKGLGMKAPREYGRESQLAQ